jgi:rod shape-determining protein MreB
MALFSNDLAIDLGTANTCVFARGAGIVLNEPSIVAVNNISDKIEAVGSEAKEMLGRTPGSITAIRPMRDGVIADFDAAERMLGYFIKKAHPRRTFTRPRVIIGVPSEITQVERRAVKDSAYRAKASEVHLIEEGMAAAIGAGMPIDEAVGNMIVDIGGGTTDIAVISLAGVVYSRSVKVAGNAMDEAIIRYVRRQHQLLIGEVNAERIKIEAGTALATANGRAAEVHIRGRDVRQGSAKSAVLRAKDIAEALAEPVDAIADFAQRALEDLPPDILSDIARRGVHLTGGGALLDKLDLALTRRVGVKFHVQQNPMHCVVKGSAAVLAGLDEHEHLLMRP